MRMYLTISSTREYLILQIIRLYLINWEICHVFVIVIPGLAMKGTMYLIMQSTIR